MTIETLEDIKHRFWCLYSFRKTLKGKLELETEIRNGIRNESPFSGRIDNRS